MIIPSIIGLVLSLKIKSAFSKYATIYFSIMLFSDLYSMIFSYMLNSQIIEIHNYALAGYLIAIPVMTLNIAANVTLFVAIMKLK